MIDGFKFRITDSALIQALLNHPRIDIRVPLSLSSGEISYEYIISKYRGLRIEYKHQYEIIIRGNLYEYYTGHKNYQNFELNDAFKALRMLERDLNIDLSKAEVIKLEWGLNIQLPETISVNRFIENILTYKGHMPNYQQYQGGGLMRSFDLNEYVIKIYDKGAQTKKLSKLLRMELAVRKKTFLRRIGIFYVSDLYDKRNIKKLHRAFEKVIPHIIFYDHAIVCENLGPRDLKLLSNFNNSFAWKDLIRKNPELYRKKKPQFRKKITALSGFDWNKLLHELISNESQKLLS